jgi:hypothetical protein
VTKLVAAGDDEIVDAAKKVIAAIESAIKITDEKGEYPSISQCHPP